MLILVSTIVVAGCGFVRTRPVRQEPIADWEPILFNGRGETKDGYDKFAQLAGMKPLRDELKYPDEIEIRFWRGAFLTDTEFVSLRFKEGKWSGIHAISLDKANLTQIKVNTLPVPRGGWAYLYNKMVELGIYEAQTETDERCSGRRFDPILNMVEISKEAVYRTAINRTGYDQCDGSRKMDLIAEHIAVSFDDGRTECKRDEWFPCGKVIREERLKEENEKK